MKFFENMKVEIKEVEKPKVDSSDFIKNNLMKSVDRSKVVRDAVQKWLFSFDGAITKEAFERQMRRLDFDDEKALLQLEQAQGRRTIPLPKPPRPPKMQGSVIENMVKDTYVAISGRGYKTVIRDTVKELKQFGTVYVLSVEELIIQFKSYHEKGSSPQMIEKAIEADF